MEKEKIITDLRECEVGDIIQEMDYKGITIVTKIETVKRIHLYNPTSEADFTEESVNDKPIRTFGVNVITNEGLLDNHPLEVAKFRKVDMDYVKAHKSTKDYHNLMKKIKEMS